MERNPTSKHLVQTPMLYRVAPGLGVLVAYRREWLRHDLIAGVSVAAVALPTAIAYAQIIGLDPVIGLYAAIPSLLAYALFGTSRHLIVNPDAATCAMIAATLTPLAAGDPEVLLSPDAVLARVPSMKGFYDIAHHADASTTPGLLFYRFGAGIVFYNASYLKKRVLDLAAAQPDLKWLVLDGGTVNTVDSTGAETLEALARDLARQGVRLGLAGFRTETRCMLERSGAMAAIGTDSVYPTLKSAMNALLAVPSGSRAGVPEAEDASADASEERSAE